VSVNELLEIPYLNFYSFPPRKSWDASEEAREPSSTQTVNT